MADRDARLADTGDLLFVEMNAVRDPGAGRHPSRLLEQVDRPHAEGGDAVDVLFLRLHEVGVKPAVEAVGERGRPGHYLLGHGERRAGRQSDLDHRTRSRIVIEIQHALAILKDCLCVLNDAVRLQTPVLLRNAHRAARRGHPYAETARFLDLDVDGVLEPAREQIVMVGDGGAAGQHQFDERHAHRDAQRRRGHARPDLLHGLEPGHELHLGPNRMGARKSLVEMVVRVDEPRQHDMARGVERQVARFGGRLAARNDFDDLRPLDDEAAGRVAGEYGERILDPEFASFVLLFRRCGRRARRR